MTNIDPTQLSQSFATSGPSGPNLSALSFKNLALFRGYRGANTILKGGWAPDVSYNRRINEMTRRKSVFRHARVESMAPSSLSTGFRVYDIDKPLNWIGRKFGATSDIYTGGMIAQIDAAARLSGRVSSEGATGLIDRVTNRSLTTLFGRGMTGGAGVVDPKIAGNVRAYQEVMGGVPGVGEMTGQEGARAILSAAPGALNQAVGGFFYGARYGGPAGLDAATMAGGTKFAAWAQRASGYRAYGGELSGGRISRIGGGLKNAYGAGVKDELTAQAAKVAGSSAVKAGGEALGKAAIARAGLSASAKYGLTIGADVLGMALPGLDILAGIQLAYTAAKLVGGVIDNHIYKPLRSFVAGAYTSLAGSINHTPFGPSFVDNAVASTSRARGVLAISNSRLNARSMLGSEAGMMAAHF